MQQGGLFTRDYLGEGIKTQDAWSSLSDAQLEELAASLGALFAVFPHGRTPPPNETQTEDDLIWKVLGALGWSNFLRQQPLSVTGRENVPDGLLFADAAAKALANGRPLPHERYGDGLAIVESKRWGRVLDRPGRGKEAVEVPSSQMLRYLRRVDDLTDGKVRWGILTNGRLWRLYHQGAKSVSENFLEIDLAAALGIEPYADLLASDAEQRRHWLKVFALMFRREAFLPQTATGQTFHDISLDEGRYYEERVAKDLSRVVFNTVFPALAAAIIQNSSALPAGARPDLAEVKNAAMVLLYRLLFILYAEDRRLLPVDDPRYDDYGLRVPVRNDVAMRLDAGDTLSSTRTGYWDHVRGLFDALANGDSSIGLPPYNGGLFDPAHTPLLDRTRIPDRVFAEAIDQLGRIEGADGARRYINYRDLSVQQLGSIYERLLEYDLVEEEGEVRVRLNPFARKGSGSYYTPDELVRLIIERALGPLTDERMAAFENAATALGGETRRPIEDRLKQLATLDPAVAMLDLKVCDPAMGSGHFLVDLVDYLADRILIATAAAHEVVDWTDYRSPLLDRVAAIRNQILAQAKAGEWTVREEQLDDRLIVRRMILKRVIYGVDKNPMAVELAKVSLWLHTFTVGAPLSFLDHHLRCGDSLFGETVRGVMDELAAQSSLLLNDVIHRARGASTSMSLIEALADADISEAHESKRFFGEVEERIAPLSNFMSFWLATDWLSPLPESTDIELNEQGALSGLLGGSFGDPIAVAAGLEAPTVATRNLNDEQRSNIEQRFVALRRLLDRTRQLTDEQRFLHWQVAFPGVWRDWESVAPDGGFDAVIGNPPWDRMKFQEVEWFAARKPDIAHAETAARRSRLVAELKEANDPLAADYERAVDRAEAATRVARGSGAYPLLSGAPSHLCS